VRRPEVRKLVFNLPRETVIQKVRESGRLLGAGKRELGFYLREVKERKLYVQQSCSTFRQFVRLNTDLEPREANELVRVSEALEDLPAIKEPARTPLTPEAKHPKRPAN
jgi:hypothetical protein